MFTQEKVNGVSCFIDTAIEIVLLPPDLDVSLVDTSGSPYRPGVTLPVLLKLRDVALDPVNNSRMCYVNTSLGHHRPHVSIAQFIREVPLCAKDEDFPIKGATLE